MPCVGSHPAVKLLSQVAVTASLSMRSRSGIETESIPTSKRLHTRPHQLADLAKPVKRTFLRNPLATDHCYDLTAPPCSAVSVAMQDCFGDLFASAVDEVAGTAVEGTYAAYAREQANSPHGVGTVLISPS